METPFTDFEFEADRINELAKGQVNSLDHQLYVQFYKHAEQNVWKSRPVEQGGEGRKVYEEFVYVRILMPANRLNVIERRATDADKLRFPKQYSQFLSKAEALQIGTPLSEMPGLTSAQVLELKALKVETVEQLAGVADSTVQLLGTGGMMLKQQAIKYLDRRQNAESLSEANRDLKSQLEDALRRIAAIESAEVKGPKITTEVKA